MGTEKCSKSTLEKIIVDIKSKWNKNFLPGIFDLKTYVNIICRDLLVVLRTKQIIIPAESSHRKAVVHPLSESVPAAGQEQRARASSIGSEHSQVRDACLLPIIQMAVH